MQCHRTPSCHLRPPAPERRDCCENRSWRCSLPFGTGGATAAPPATARTPISFFISSCSPSVELHGVVHEARAEEAHSAFAARDGDRDGVLPGDEGVRGDIDRELHVVST